MNKPTNSKANMNKPTNIIMQKKSFLSALTITTLLAFLGQSSVCEAGNQTTNKQLPANTSSAAVSAAAVSAVVTSGSTLITFDDLGLSALGAVTNQYASSGVVFQGFTDAGDQVNLDVADSTVYSDNNPPSAPFSLSNFYNNDQTQRAHIIRIKFSPAANNISLMFDSAGDSGTGTVFNVYNTAGSEVDSFHVAAATDGNYHPVSVPDANVAYIDIVAPSVGWGFYIDNVQFTLASYSTPWPDATDLGNGWRNSSWFGKFNVNNYPWIYHAQHGWLYVFGTDPTSIWMWTPDTVAPWTGFVWTGEGVYPWLWSDTQQTWLYYSVGSSNPRYFYNWNAQKWVKVNP